MANRSKDYTACTVAVWLLCCGFANAESAAEPSATWWDSVTAKFTDIAEVAWQWASLWNVVGASTLVFFVVGGFLLWHYIGAHSYGNIRLAGLCFHTVFQFLPLYFYALVNNLFPSFEFVHCDTGLWWPVHWLYGFALVPAMWSLCDYVDAGRVEFLCEGKLAEDSFLLRSFAYVLAFFNATDQYLDAMTTAIALACGWQWAWVMLLVLVAGFFLQAACAAYATRQTSPFTGCFWSVVGFSPKLVLVMIKRDKTLSYHSSARKRMSWRKFIANQGITKFATENVPQAVMAIMFAQQVKASSTVWLSVVVSLTLAALSAYEGIRYYYFEEHADEEAVEEDEEESLDSFQKIAADDDDYEDEESIEDAQLAMCSW